MAAPRPTITALIDEALGLTGYDAVTGQELWTHVVGGGVHPDEEVREVAQDAIDFMAE